MTKRNRIDGQRRGKPGLQRSPHDLDRRLEQARLQLAAKPSQPGFSPAPLLSQSDTPPTLPNRLVEYLLHVGYADPSVLNKNASAIVVRATQLSNGRTVAIKLLPPARDHCDDDIRLAREVDLMQSVRHPNLVQLFDLHRLPNGWSAIVMEFVAGGTLADRLRREGRIEPLQAARIVAQVARGLAALHSAGLSHRDIKPANILLDEQGGVAKLADFGLSRPLQRGQTITSQDVVPGTPRFMSPERFRAEACDLRLADVYGLGAVLYECLHAEPLFSGPLPALIAQILYSSPRRLEMPTGIPVPLQRICRRALAKSPQARYDSASSLARDLDLFRQNPVRYRDLIAGLVRQTVRCLSLPMAIGLLLVATSWTGPRVGTAKSIPPASSAVVASLIDQPNHMAAPSGATAIQWALYQNRVNDPRPSARRTAAARAMLHVLDAMGVAALKETPYSETSAAGLAISKCRLLLEVHDFEAAARIAVQATTLLETRLSTRSALQAGSRQAGSDLSHTDELQMATRAHRFAALALTHLNRIPAAREHARRAESLARRWCALDSESPAALILSARCLVTRARLLSNKPDQGNQLLLNAMRNLASLPRAAASSQPAYCDDVAEAYREVAESLQEAAEYRRADEAYRLAASWKTRGEPASDDPSQQFDRATLWVDWSDTLARLGQPAEARAKLALAERAIEALVQRDGDYSEYRRLADRIADQRHRLDH